MDWTSPFIIYRISGDAKLEEVFHAVDMKKAKYWLTYIGQPGDILCRTPAHPKHSQKGKIPEYWQHKEVSGQPSSQEEKWKEFAKQKNFDFKFPEIQLGKPDA